MVQGQYPCYMREMDPRPMDAKDWAGEGWCGFEEKRKRERKLASTQELFFFF